MNKGLLILTTLLLILPTNASSNPSTPPAAPAGLRVCDNHRFLVTEDGKPFFWMADTAWQLLHDLNEAEMRHYFADRRDKGFNVIQTVALAEHRFNQTNAFGHLPIEPQRPDKPIVKDGPGNDYWDDVELAVRLAGEHGLYVGLLPTWGDKVTKDFFNGKVNGFFTPENAEAYGRFIGARLKAFDNIIWILGGDRAAPTDEAKAVWRAMARGIAIGVSGSEDYSKVLMTFHPSGPGDSAEFFHNDTWLDFNGIQSSHGPAIANGKLIERDYRRMPTKPVIDLETTYAAITFKKHGSLSDDMARGAAYRAVFSGACGHTYGHNSIWQMFTLEKHPMFGSKTPWREALDAPSALQMGYLRRFIESFNFLSQQPDDTLLACAQTGDVQMCLALRGDGYALIYTPTGRTLDINLYKISGEKVTAAWFNPRTGATTALQAFDTIGRRSFDPPGAETQGNDWVLVLRSDQIKESIK